MKKENVAIKKSTAKHLAPSGKLISRLFICPPCGGSTAVRRGRRVVKLVLPLWRGRHVVPGEGVYNKANFMGTPSSPLWGTSKAEKLFDNPPTPLRGTSPARGAEKAAVCAKHPARGEVNTGFTLIELLVVVLIIGILAAVAVPQYKVAVEKSRLTEALTFAKSVKDAQERYYLANGAYTQKVADLDISFPSSGGGTIQLPSGIKVMITLWYVYANNAADTNTLVIHYTHNNSRPDSWFCYAKRNDTLANRVCQSLGGKNPKQDNGCVIGPCTVYTL